MLTAMLAVTTALAFAPLAVAAGGGSPATTARMIVSERSPASTEAERLVGRLGGRVYRKLAALGGFAAEVPRHRVGALVGSPFVVAAWPDAAVRLHELESTDVEGPDLAEYDELPPNTVWQRAIGLGDAGDGGGDQDSEHPTVAVLDTGVTEVADLGNRVLTRVDLTPDQDGWDRYGHGTHMAGIVAGDGKLSDGRWRGVAPKARLVPVKVAGWNGATDVSVVLAGVEWVVAHKDAFGIRVLNLSFGTDSTQSALQDPLNHAVQRAWAAGILVVVAAGNRGPAPGTVSKPGDDPYSVTVGAVDVKGTEDPADDEVAGFSSAGPTLDGFAKPDLVAPGISIVSHRAPDSTADALRPAARVDDAYFKGTGTSQAAAVVSGVAALMFRANPSLTPDAAKATLMATATAVSSVDGRAGAGTVNAGRAVEAAEDGTYAADAQGPPRSSGLGLLEASRGSLRVYTDLDGDGESEPVTGEIDALGRPWDAAAWSSRAWTVETWDSSPWAELTALSPGWKSRSWSSRSWSGMGWDSRSWSSRSWSEAGWDSWWSRSWSANLWN